MSNEIYEKLEICRKSILQKTNFKPEVAVILGSGLGEYASKIKIEQIIPYTEIEGFPVSTVVAMLRGRRSLPCRDVCIIMKGIR